jgi:hypothetical protein
MSRRLLIVCGCVVRYRFNNLKGIYRKIKV